MATILYSSIVSGSTVVFDPASDVLVFDTTAISAASLTVSYASDFTSISFTTLLGTTFSLTSGVSLAALTTSNITFVDGSQFIFGDNSSSLNDSLSNTLVGGIEADQLFGHEGNDLLLGFMGNDLLNGGTGADTMKGSLGNDLYVVDDVNDVVDETPTLDTTRISTDADGAQVTGACINAKFSADGRYMVFQSGDSNLVAGDMNGVTDIFVKDLETGNIQLVSTTRYGWQLDVSSLNPQISADGRYVVFQTDSAMGLVEDINGFTDIFVKDLQTGSIQRVSIATNGAEGNGISSNAKISADGRYVLFESDAANLVAGDWNNARDVFLKDLQTGEIRLVSSDAFGGVATNDGYPLYSRQASFSANGRYVVFESSAQNLTGYDGDAHSDIFVKDLQTWSIQRASINAYGALVDLNSANAHIAADGRYVVFESIATNLVDNDTNGAADIFVKDLQTGAIQRVSTAANGAEGNLDSSNPQISNDGHYVVFQSNATNLTADSYGYPRTQIFVKDLQTGDIERVSLDSTQWQGNAFVFRKAQFSADGHYVVFETNSSNMIAGDTNYTYDIFRVANPFLPKTDNGIDTVRSSVNYILPEQVENLTLTGSLAINGTGNALGNALIGNGEVNILSGAAGNDTLDGGAGADALAGGTDNDTYVVDNSGDVVTEAQAAGTDTVQSSVTHTLAANVEHLILIGAAAINGIGNSLANHITGNSAANLLNGSSGADTLIGGAGNDTYVIDSSSDVVTEVLAAGTDTVQSSVTHTLAANLENLTLTGTTAINGTGNSLANILTGNTATNILNGGLGADTLTGGLGNDTYVVDSTGDLITELAGAGNDTIQSATTYSLLDTDGAGSNGGNVEHLALTGTAAINGTGNSLANSLTGNSGANTLAGGDGNDTLNGGTGNDVLSGGNGTDTASFAGNLVGVQVSLTFTTSQDTGAGIDTLSAIENLTGSSYDDTLIGNSLANVIDGGAGLDLLMGGLGNDTYIVDSLGDVVSEEANEGTDTVQAKVSYKLGDNVENIVLLGTGNLSALGNGLANTLTGNAGSNLLNGSSGSDTVSYSNASGTVTASLATNTATGYGSDTFIGIENLTGGNYGDTLTGNSLANVLDGGAGNDTMTGGDGSDTYYLRDTGDVVSETNATASSGGTDTVYSYLATHTLGSNVENGRILSTGAANLTGNSLANVLYAGAGNNTLDGGTGTDAVSYAYGLAGTTGVTVSLAVSGAQTTGGSGSDTLVAIENLTGSAYADNLTGNALANTLNGGAGNDVLTGGAGTDSLIGGLGNDTFDFNALSELGLGSTRDVISGWNAGDKIDLTTIDWNTTTAGDQAFAYIGSGVFTATSGQVRYSGGVLQFNTDTDTAVEYEIVITGNPPATLVAGTDIVL
jgi:Ca2+-binding RTX toxin-like protein